MEPRSTASDLHYEDGSHRWTPPRADLPVEGWRAQVRAHVEEAARLGGCVLPARKKVRPASGEVGPSSLDARPAARPGDARSESTGAE